MQPAKSNLSQLLFKDSINQNTLDSEALTHLSEHSLQQIVCVAACYESTGLTVWLSDILFVQLKLYSCMDTNILRKRKNELTRLIRVEQFVK